MNSKINNQINIEVLFKELLDDYPQTEWRTTVWDITKKINSANEEKIKSKDLKKMFRASIREKKNNLKIESRKNSPNELIPLSKLLKWDSGEIKWAIKDLLPENGIAILSGDPKNFKTWSTLHFALCIAEGKPVYNHFETTKGNVLIIDEEDGYGLLQQRVNILSAEEKSKIYFMIMTGFKINYEENMQKVFRYIKKHKIKTIIIDSLVRIHLGDENSSKDIAQLFGELRRITIKGVAILLNHHHRKKSNANKGRDSQPMRGSTDILAAIDCHMQIEHKDNQLIIEQTKNRFGIEIKPFAVDVKQEDNKMYFTYSGESNLPLNQSSRAKKIILDLLADKNDWLSREEIDSQLNGEVGKNNIGKALTELSNNGDVEQNTSNKGKKHIERQ